ncbi:cytochrome b-c1 complex subunit 7 [Magallana gigas]|uniref:Cytochrome b-c1 complex subunit 7 n=3 Tax=Magallana gigas TaxID=29159 RepID=A0A8W8MRJ6_MAGGI|nr:cytochrome b-c1 complex subunit 7 [Crassostrea gigas]|eukprot:XP_011412259.1 PREDICTED: cytochrome b-c1 complex subunit 7 [Crassostrea gigas]
MASQAQRFKYVNRGLKYNLQRWMYYKSFFPSLGLWRDDMRRETPILKEALKRISRQDLEARNFRIARATVLYNAKIELPREQWTELDEDKLYLTPHVEAIKKELKERKDFEKSK